MFTKAVKERARKKARNFVLALRVYDLHGGQQLHHIVEIQIELRKYVAITV